MSEDNERKQARQIRWGWIVGGLVSLVILLPSIILWLIGLLESNWR